MGGRRMYSTRSDVTGSHPAIPDKGTWSLASVIHPAAVDSEDVLTDHELLKLHKLAALVPPSTPAEMQKLREELQTLLRLVRGIHPPHRASDEKKHASVEVIDSRVLASDPEWHVCLQDQTSDPGSETAASAEPEEGTGTLDRDSQLLSHVDKSRKYAGYFVVDRT